jgi:hypothetical protein
MDFFVQNPHSMDLPSPSSETDSNATVDMRNSMVSNGPDGGGMQDQSRPLYYLSINFDGPTACCPCRMNIYPKNRVMSYQPILKRQPNDEDPITIGPKECDNLRAAIRDGSGFIIGIGIPRFHKFQPINSPIVGD